MHRGSSFIKRLITAAFIAGFSILSTAADAQAPTFQIENNELKVPGPVYFETGSDKLKPESDAVLEHVKSYLEAKTYVTLRVEVHTDNSGNADANQTLTEKRALAVAKWLTGHGADCKRIIPVGFGGNKPIAANDSPENKAKNRRVTFVNAKLRNIPIGGMPVDGGGRIAGDPCSK